MVYLPDNNDAYERNEAEHERMKRIHKAEQIIEELEEEDDTL